jgi:hypothetical protein
MPYRPLNNRADGGVITFAGTTAGKKLEATLHQNQPTQWGNPMAGREERWTDEEEQEEDGG